MQRPKPWFAYGVIAGIIGSAVLLLLALPDGGASRTIELFCQLLIFVLAHQ